MLPRTGSRSANPDHVDPVDSLRSFAAFLRGLPGAPSLGEWVVHQQVTGGPSRADPYLVEFRRRVGERTQLGRSIGATLEEGVIGHRDADARDRAFIEGHLKRLNPHTERDAREVLIPLSHWLTATGRSSIEDVVQQVKSEAQHTVRSGARYNASLIEFKAAMALRPHVARKIFGVIDGMVRGGARAIRRPRPTPIDQNFITRYGNARRDSASTPSNIASLRIFGDLLSKSPRPRLTLEQLARDMCKENRAPEDDRTVNTLVPKDSKDRQPVIRALRDLISILDRIAPAEAPRGSSSSEQGEADA